MPTGFYNTDKIYDKYDEFLLSPRAQELICIEEDFLKNSGLSEENIKITQSGIKTEFIGWITETGSGSYNHTNIPIITPQGAVRINVDKSPDFNNKDAFVSWLIAEIGNWLAGPLYSQ